MLMLIERIHAALEREPKTNEELWEFIVEGTQYAGQPLPSGPGRSSEMSGMHATPTPIFPSAPPEKQAELRRLWDEIVAKHGQNAEPGTLEHETYEKKAREVALRVGIRGHKHGDFPAPVIDEDQALDEAARKLAKEKGIGLGPKGM